MVEIYLDPFIIIIATIIVVGMVGFFDFLPYENPVRVKPKPLSDQAEAPRKVST